MRKKLSIISLVMLSLFFTACCDLNSTASEYALSDGDRKLLVNWKGSKKRAAQTNTEADNIIIVVNEDEHHNKFKADGKPISALPWPIRISLFEDSKTLGWSSGTA